MSAAFTLLHEATCRGTDFWGRPSAITMSPSRLPGWYWKQPDGTALPINHHLIGHARPRRIILRHERNALHVFEHIGVLRFLGLDRICLHASRWPPYHGCAGGLWTALSSACAETPAASQTWVTVTRPITWRYPRHRGGQEAFTTFLPAKEQKLFLAVLCNFPGIGEREVRLCLPDDQHHLPSILHARAFGHPGFLRHPARFASKIGLWPHAQRICWFDGSNAEAVLDEIVWHRAQDLLGALSILCCDGRMLAGTVVSHCSGHYADAQVVHEAGSHLITLV